MAQVTSGSAVEVQPEDGPPKLAVFLSISDEDFESVARNLENAPSPTNRRAYQDSVLDDLDQDLAHKLREGLAFLMALAEVWGARDFEITPKRRATLSRDALGDSATEVEVETLSDRLGRLFAADATAIIAGSTALYYAHAHLATTTKVVTEVRPVVIDGKVRASVITHTLNIEYSGERYAEVSSYFDVAMDHADLVALRSQVDRALRTHALLQVDASLAGTAIWQPYEEIDESLGEEKDLS